MYLKLHLELAKTSVCDAIKDWGVTDNIASLFFDTTSSNTGLTLLLLRSSIDDLVFSVFPSNFVKLSYKISLLKNRFVTLFFIRFSYNFQKVTLISSRTGRCVICALIL